MAVIAVLNTLVQADTSQFEGKMTRGEVATGKLATKVKDSSREMTQSLNSMGGNGIGNAMQTALSSINGQVAGVTARIGQLVSTVGALTATAVLTAGAIIGVGVGLNMMANRGAESIVTLRTMATQAGLTTEAMSALSTLGGAGGPEAFGRAMTTMQRNLVNASEETTRALSRIRLDPSQLRGQSSEQQLRIISNAFANTADHATRTAAAMAIFGDSGASMVEELSRGSAGLDQMAARAQRFGLVFSESQGLAVRNANREWANFGLAIEGIRRQAAIMFAPLWESIGRIGGDVGEWLVGAFRNAVPYIERGATWVRIVYETFESLYEPVMSAYLAIVRALTIGPWIDIASAAMDAFGIRWTDVQTFALTTFAVIKVGLENIGLLWRLSLNTIELGWLNLSRAIGTVISNIMTTIRDGLVIPLIGMMRRLLDSMSGLATLDPTGRLRDGLNLARASLAGVEGFANGLDLRFGTADLDRRIAELREAIGVGLGDFGGRVGALVGRWTRELAGGIRDAGRTAAEAVATRTTTGRDRAITGHEATLSTSERAFSMLYNTRGNETFYQQQTATATRDSRTFLERLVRATEAAPMLRRARI